jgi:hypothetical protein
MSPLILILLPLLTTLTFTCFLVISLYNLRQARADRALRIEERAQDRALRVEERAQDRAERDQERAQDRAEQAVQRAQDLAAAAALRADDFAQRDIADAIAEDRHRQVMRQASRHLLTRLGIESLNWDDDLQYSLFRNYLQ